MNPASAGVAKRCEAAHGGARLHARALHVSCLFWHTLMRSPESRKWRLDRIAREAARLIAAGRAAGVPEAIVLAAEILGETGGPMPGAGRVRQHAQAMTMQELGDAGYAALQREHLTIAEELMTAIEQAFPDASTLFVGRGAMGKIDAGVTHHIRVYTDESITSLAKAIVEYGYSEPAFETVQTRFGPLNRLRLREEGVEIALTRCLPAMRESSPRDLFTGKPIAALTLAQVRHKLQIENDTT